MRPGFRGAGELTTFYRSNRRFLLSGWTPHYTIAEIGMFEARSAETKKNLIRLHFERTQRELEPNPTDLKAPITETRNTIGVFEVNWEVISTSTTRSSSSATRPIQTKPDAEPAEAGRG